MEPWRSWKGWQGDKRRFEQLRWFNQLARDWFGVPLQTKVEDCLLRTFMQICNKLHIQAVETKIF